MNIWPFRKQESASTQVPVSEHGITPPVDLDRPLENPELKAAIQACFSSPTPEHRRVMAVRLCRANYLVASLVDEGGLQINPSTGAAHLAGGSKIGFLSIADDAGKRYLPLFTDWDELRAYTSDKVAGMVLPADQAWDMITSAPADYDGVIINPAGQLVKMMADQVRAMRADTRTVESTMVGENTRIQFRAAQSVPQNVLDAWSAICRANPQVLACQAFDVRYPGSEEIKIMVELTLTDPDGVEAVASSLMDVIINDPAQASRTMFVLPGTLNHSAPHLAFYRRA